MADVFLSYSREDRERAFVFADALEAEGLSVWWDTVLRPGENYDEVTETNLRTASAVVVLWSKHSVKSKWVRAEATIGQRKSALVPVMIEEADRPVLFELIQTSDLSHWDGDREDREWRAFVEVLRARVASEDAAREAGAPGASAAPAESPAKEESDAPKEDHSMEMTFWQSISASESADDFEAYLERYPEGHFVSLARNRLATLKAREADEARREEARREEAQREAERREAEQKEAERRDRERQEEARREAALAAERARAQEQEAHTPPPRAGAKSSGGSNMGAILGIGAVVLIGGGAAAFFLLGQGGEPGQRSAAREDTSSAGEAESRTAIAEVAPPSEAIRSNEPATESPARDTESPQAPSGDAAPAESAAAVLQTDSGVAPARAGQIIRDCDVCPELVALPGGTFTMGSPRDEPGRYGYEGPQRDVTIAPFAIGRTEVTFDEWEACVADGGCNGHEPFDRRWGKEDRPVIFVTWRHAQAYVRWLSDKTGRDYRLPTEAEWEYAARGGTNTAYWWGNSFAQDRVVSGRTQPVASKPANPFGLHDMLGNAREWVEDCYVSSFANAPTDGSAVTSGDCSRRVIRGGSWNTNARDTRVANRGRFSQTVQDDYISFRVAASL